MEKRLAYAVTGDYARFRQAIHEHLTLAAAEMIEFIRPLIAEDMMSGNNKMLQGHPTLMDRLRNLPRFAPQDDDPPLALPPRYMTPGGKIRMHGDGFRGERRSNRE